MRSQKKAIPEIAWDPGAERAGDEQTTCDIFPDRGPIHHKIMTGRGDSFGRNEPFPKRSATFHAHVHLGVPFHDAFDSFVRLLPRLSDKFAGKEKPEED